MSDPMTKGEIEDVLSSIRQLVTEGDAPSKPSRKADDKLVLTAALRVDKAVENANGSDHDASTEAVAEAAIASDSSGGDLEREVAELEAALLGRSDANKAEETEVAEQPKDATLQADISAASSDAGEPAKAEGEVVDAEDFDPWENADDGDVAGFAKAGAEVDDAEVTESEPPPAAVPMFAKSGRGRPVAEDIVEEVADDLAENVGQPDLESLLDENELRALVAEVLREELKGPLGERITRNVRKLVRREIAQALSSLEID